MKVMRRSAIVGIAIISLLALSACSSNKADEAMPEEAPVAAVGNIVEVAVGAGNFTTLAAALTAAGLVETLSGPGPFTVFAPTDDAFAALPAGLVDKLLMPEHKDHLVQLLTYHVVAGQVMAADIMDGDVKTVEGSTVKLATMDGVMVNDAKVISADVMASNGVIHAIDKVILPPKFDVAGILKK